ncbi:RNA-binding transcriptional accessory protein [Salipaludibacillus agaradhaerens]|uniref:RNA-binding transcriptional accessory protein n=1 Tax=Salipaludibacillus agaradhaerens TaxID=76935 RepID=A0A9Q4B3T0_SALAG|nr:Tex family protein [Salipaludibacillus agaradhaerens]MCR6097791.1 RNA-binding transcriptional accessory protein [Salipaludibacillus agaradhaerens]MCR6116580.1 RNA-binding transcriptional accessory protein [Salipaludibacillus agaradhaerens]
MEWNDQLNELLALVAAKVQLQERRIKSVIELAEEGNTVPFIARYRKEMTGGMDEDQIRQVLEGWEYANSLAKRKEEVIRLIDEQEKLTPELKRDIEKATKLQELEDIYRPYKQKRKTKASVAKEKGLEPLAMWLLSLPKSGDIEQEAKKYISVEHDLHTIEPILQGAQDIISEMLSDDPEVRKYVRQLTFKEGAIESEKKAKADDEKAVFEMYYEYSEQVQKIVPHRILALNRGEKEGILKVSVKAPDERIMSWIENKVMKGAHTIAQPLLADAVADGYKRLIQPSVEREIRKEVSETAEEQAIHIFSENLRNLLLQPPLKGQVVLGVDPAYRTGCKLAVVDETGKMLEVGVIYPTKPWNKIEEAKQAVFKLITNYKIKMIAIGNGTASRETEQFIADLLKEIEDDIFYLIVNEAGASVYSASKIAKEEFPNLQVEERSAVSIARRIQDPLAELVKIDPKSVGVGQYQHDVTQSKLNNSLTFVVETVVNQVGVNVNTASSSLLQYVSGLSKSVADNIVTRREEEGKFTNRTQLKKVPRLGAKTYEQSIGFIRILDGEQPLDQTGIHPESYSVTKDIMKELGMSVTDIGTEKVKDKLQTVSINDLAEQYNVGIPTLNDILEALTRPGRDPRDDIQKPLLKTDILSMEDLAKGMELQGTVRNVVDFGAFVDIGVKQDGLVHISKLANRFVKHPMEVVSVGDLVTVWVDDVDAIKGRVALTMLEPANQSK